VLVVGVLVDGCGLMDCVFLIGVWWCFFGGFALGL